MVKDVTAIIQARTGSSRLPNKVLMKINNKTILNHLVSRVARADKIKKIVIATTNKVGDDAIESECKSLGIEVFRGSKDDVLGRYFEAAKCCNAEHIMRICADNPLIEPTILGELITFYEENNFGYVRNEKTPLGLAAELFSFDRLHDANKNGLEKYHREHVTPYMYENDFDCGRLYFQPNLEHLRFTLDTPEDLKFIEAIYSNFNGNEFFGLNEILQLLNDQPELLNINKSVVQRTFKE